MEMFDCYCAQRGIKALMHPATPILHESNSRALNARMPWLTLCTGISGFVPITQLRVQDVDWEPPSISCWQGANNPISRMILTHLSSSEQLRASGVCSVCAQLETIPVSSKSTLPPARACSEGVAQ